VFVVFGMVVAGFAIVGAGVLVVSLIAGAAALSLLVTAVFAPVAYELADSELVVVGRLGGRPKFRVTSARAQPVPALVASAGIGQAFGLVGWAWTKQRESLLVLATDWDHATCLETDRRRLVISPADVEAFKEGLGMVLGD
jgi:hypothetical protein